MCLNKKIYILNYTLLFPCPQAGIKLINSSTTSRSIYILYLIIGLLSSVSQKEKIDTF